MKANLLRFSLILGALALSSCSAKTVVRHVEATKLKRQGVFYALPRTVVVVDVPVKRVEATEGRYKDWSKILLGTGPNVDLSKPGEKPLTFSIQKPDFSTYGIPDADEIYMVEIKGRYFEDKLLDLGLSEDGVLQKFEAESTDHSVEAVLAGTSAIAGLIGKGLTFQGGPELADSLVGEETNRVEKETGAIPPREAVEAALLIRGLTSRRDSLLGGEFPAGTEAGALEMALEKLEQRIKQLSEFYFLGNRSVSDFTFEYTVDPQPAGVDEAIIQLDPEKGVCSPPAELYFPASFKTDKATNCREVRLAIKRQTDGTVWKKVDTAKQTGKVNGFYYRIPGPATVELRFLDELKGDSVLQVAQYGTVVALPPGSGGRRTKYTIDLHPGSGALKNFALGSDSLLQSDDIKTAGEAASGLLDSIQARREARREANQPPDELKTLERERMILEERKKIQELREALGLEDTGG